MRPIRILIALMAVLFITGFYCTKVEYNNPLDNKSANYAGDSAAADDNHDGIPNLYDRTWMGITKTYPKIVFEGPDTVVIAKNDPQHILATLKVTATDSLWAEPGKLWGDLTDSIKQSSSIFTSVCSTFTIVYTVRNLIDSQTSRSRTIIVDCEPPAIVLKGESQLRLVMGTAYVESGADAMDNIDGNLTSKIAITGTVHTNTEGVDTVTYTVTDKAGNIGVQKRTVVVYKVVVKDEVPPVLTLNGSNPLTIMQNAVFSDPGITAVDNIDGPIAAAQITKTITTSTGGTANFTTFTSIAGSYIITYSAVDAATNRAIITRTVTVQGIITGKDSTPPVITFLVCSQCTTKIGTAWTVPGYTAFDDHDGDVTNKVVAPAAPNLNVPGTTKMVYTVADSTGNSATYNRYVTVVGNSTDSIKPVITLDPPVQCTVSLGKSFTDPGYSATDNADGVITNKVTRTVKNTAGLIVEFGEFYKTIDKYTFTYTVSDASGNAAVPAVRNVVVKDTVIDTTTNGDLLKKYGVPLTTALSSVSHTYTAVSLDGKGPSITSITGLQLAWRNDPNSKGLDNFALNGNFTNTTYLNLIGKITQTFDQPQPGFILTGSGITGLDGEYYIKATATECDWVKKDGSYAIVFK